MTILPPPRWPSTKYWIASGTRLNGKVSSITAAVILAGLHELPQDLQVPAVLASNSASVTAGQAAATRSTSCSIPSLRCLSSLHPTDWLEPLESGLVDSGGIKHASQCSVR
jgi:hypothetical protein